MEMRELTKLMRVFIVRGVRRDDSWFSPKTIE
jgi:hypothetical protein